MVSAGSKAETRVNYKATANFLSAVTAVRKLKKEIQDLRKEEAALNAQSVAGSAAATAANLKKAKSADTASKSWASETIVVDKLTGEVRDFGNAQKDADKISQALTNTVKKAAQEQTKLGNVLDKNTRSTKTRTTEQTRFRSSLANSIPLVEGLHKQLDKIDDFRPHLIPPFIALIPIIGALLALINPLVAILGSLGAAAIGAGSSLASLAGAAVAIVPALAAAASGVAAILTSFKGIGSAFSAFSAAKKATGGGGGGKSVTETLADAEDKYTNSLIDEQQAQDRLADARKSALRQLQDLQKAVDRATASEADANASLQKAQENYYDVLADTSSTAGDKAQALADLTDAQNNLADVQQQNTRNQEDLTEAQSKGVEGDDQVVAAKQALTKSIKAENDALADLQKAQAGVISGGGGGGGLNQFQAALDKLSPSAKAFVLGIIAMEGAWKKLQLAVQESFFSQFVGDLGLLNKLLGPIQGLLVKAATASGKFADNLLKLVTSDKWLADFNVIGDNSATLLTLMGQAALSLLSAIEDLAVAVGPFAIELAKGLKAGADNFAVIVDNARKSGSLAKWLETIRQRLDQWWRIVKNVGKTLFNFGAASADFGKWITGGLESMTANWLKVSEDARKKGSPFQTWLEDVKPLLKQVRGLFGDFFKWLGREAADKGNIKFATDLLKTIRDDLGPAVSKLLDALTNSGISQSFVEALSSIVGSLSELISNGGASGFKSFLDVLEGVFKVLADAFKNPGLAPFLTTIATALGGLTALSFIGKFTGLTSLIGWLIKLSKAGTLTAILSKVTSFFGTAAATTKTAAQNAANRVTGGGAAFGGGSVNKKTGLAPPTVLSTGKAAKTGTKAPKFGSGGSIASSLKTGALVGGIVLGAQTIGVQSRAAASGIGGVLDAAGAPLRKRQPGEGANYQQNAQTEKVANIKKAGASAAYNVAANGISTQLISAIVSFFAGDKAAAAVKDFFGTLNVNFQHWIADTAIPATVNFFTKVLPNAWNGFIGWLRGVWNGFVGWLTGVWNGFTGWLRGIFSGIGVIIGNIGTWFSDLIGNIGSWFSGFIGNIGTWFSDLIGTIGTWFSGLVGNIGAWFSSLPSTIASFFSGIGDKIAAYASGIGDKIAGFASGIGDKIAGFFKSLPDTIAGFFKGIGGAIAGFVKTALHNLHIPGFATGGSVALNNANKKPSRSDTVAAMLTPGEFVMKKSAVDHIGTGVLNSMNNGGFAKGMSFFANGGLVPQATKLPSLQGGVYVTNNIIINNPKREKSSDSLPGALRKVAYINSGRRKMNDRLTGVGDDE